jgi:hypothetical protein
MKNWFKRNLTLEGVLIIVSLLLGGIATLWGMNSKYWELVYTDKAIICRVDLLEQKHRQSEISQKEIHDTYQLLKEYIESRK